MTYTLRRQIHKQAHDERKVIWLTGTIADIPPMPTWIELATFEKQTDKPRAGKFTYAAGECLKNNKAMNEQILGILAANPDRMLMNEMLNLVDFPKGMTTLRQKRIKLSSQLKRLKDSHNVDNDGTRRFAKWFLK